MSTMQEITKPVSAVGAQWSTGIHCPGCGADAESINRARMPKWRCPDPTCDFARGWRLIPSAGVIYALPVGDDPAADPSKTPALRNKDVPWLKTEAS